MMTLSSQPHAYPTSPDSGAVSMDVAPVLFVPLQCAEVTRQQYEREILLRLLEADFKEALEFIDSLHVC